MIFIRRIRVVYLLILSSFFKCVSLQNTALFSSFCLLQAFLLRKILGRKWKSKSLFQVFLIFLRDRLQYWFDKMREDNPYSELSFRGKRYFDPENSNFDYKQYLKNWSI